MGDHLTSPELYRLEYVDVSSTPLVTVDGYPLGDILRSAYPYGAGLKHGVEACGAKLFQVRVVPWIIPG